MVFLVSNFMELNYFQCKDNGNISVMSDFTFLCVSFNTPYDTASNSTCQLSDQGILCKALFVNWKNYSLSFSFFPSASREWVALKFLFCTVISPWIDFTNIIDILTLVLLLFYYYYYYYFGFTFVLIEIEIPPDILGCYWYSSSQ